MKKAFLVSAVIIASIFAAFFIASDTNVRPATSTTVPTPTQEEQQGIIPARMEIPAIGVDAKVESVELDPINNAMANPSDTRNVAWYSLGFKPGENGSSVISGHYDKRDASPAVFYKLNSLKQGDLIFVYDQIHRLRYEVITVVQYPVDSFPLEKVFNTKGHVGLNLITCSGAWNTTSQNYSKRTVVYATLRPDD